MRHELEEKLFKDFPLLYDKEESVRISLMCFGFECGDGWYQLIRELSEKLMPLIEKARNEQDEDACRMRAVQVKEKYGTMRFYMSSETGEMAKLIDEYTDASASICEQCGEPGRIRSSGYWMSTRCDEHAT